MQRVRAHRHRRGALGRWERFLRPWGPLCGQLDLEALHGLLLGPAHLQGLLHLVKGPGGKVRGRGGELEGDAVVEWYAGQILDICDNRQWFAMNSIINSLDRFVPESRA